MTHSVGDFVNGRPIICGGNNHKTDADNVCFEPGIGTEIKMVEHRTQAAGVVWDNWFWVTGGWNGTHLLHTTELVNFEQGAFKGPDIPYAIKGHCVHWVNQTHIFFLDFYSGYVFFYDIPKGIFVDMMPFDPSHRLEDYSCAMMINMKQGVYQQLMVAGDKHGSKWVYTYDFDHDRITHRRK